MPVESASSAVTAIVVLFELVAGASFTIIASKLYRVSKTLDSAHILSYSLGFLLLAASSILMAASAVTGPRLGASLYLSSTILASGGFYMLRPIKYEGSLAVVPGLGLKPLFMAFDSLAGILGLYVASGVGGFARLLAALVALSHLGRSSALVAGLLGFSPVYTALMLAASEAVRGASSAFLAVYYAVPGDGGGEEEEE